MVKKKPLRIFSKEEILKASQVDIVDFVSSFGKGELTGRGRYPKYLINGHESMTIDRKNNYFYHNGQNRGNNIIVLLKDYEGYSFQGAVAKLLGEDLAQHTPYDELEEPEAEYKYRYQPDRNNDIALDYMIEQRGIDSEIINYLVDNGYMMQDREYKSAILNWKDTGLPDGEVVGATSVVTGDRRGGSGKYIMETSRRHYGFNVTLGVPKKMYFFEASIDMLSYWSMNKDLTDARLICLEGLKDKTVLNFIEETYREFNVLPSEGLFYGVDNDWAGHRLYDRVNRDVTIRQSLDSDELIPTMNLMPNDQAISRNVYDIIQEVATAKEVDWKVLTSVLKVETNLTDSENLANGYNLYGNFAKSDKESNGKATIDVPDRLNALADRLINESITLENIELLYTNEPHSELDIAEMKTRFTDYYQVLENEEFQVVDQVIEDWNDVLTAYKADGLVTERVPLLQQEVDPDYVSNSKKSEFSYYLQDAVQWDVASHRLVNHYQVDPMIVQALMKKGFIRQDENNRIVYLWNNKGNVVGGQITGTFEDKSFGREKIEKGVLELSAKGYGFNVNLGRQPKAIYFFQTPEDLLSYWSLNKDVLQEATLFSLSDDSPNSMIQILNERLEAGANFEKIHIAINHDKPGKKLLDEITLLDAYEREDRSLKTSLGKLIPIQSERPIYGATWQLENVAKKERMAKLKDYEYLQEPVQSQQHVQQHTMSQTR